MSLNNQEIKEKLLFYIHKLVDLKPDEDHQETIKNLNALLISSNYNQIRDVANQLPLEKFFHRFNNENELSDQLITLFKLFLEALPSDQIIIQYCDSVLEGISSSKHQVIELWLKRIVEPTFKNTGLLKNVCDSNVNLISLMKSIVRLIRIDNVLIATCAQEIALSFAKDCRIEFFSPQIQDELCSLANSNIDINKIRFYELCVNIACVNELLFDQIESNKFITDLAKDFENSLDKDPLIAINIIKLVTDLVSQKQGLTFIKSSTLILPKTVDLIAKAQIDDLISSLILPGLINFIFRIAEFDINILSQYPVVMQKIVEFCEQRNNHELLLLSIDSIAYLSRKNIGKCYIEPYAPTILKTIAWMINSANQDLKQRALESLSEMMELRDADPGNKATQLTEQWFEMLSTNGCSFSRFVELAKDPSPDIRVRILNFFRILSQSVWGQKLIAENTEFLDYLLDSTAESSKSALDAKYQVVQELSMSPFIGLTFSPELIQRIRDYLRSAPQTKEVNVAFENA